jgi:hypothetical protein
MAYAGTSYTDRSRLYCIPCIGALLGARVRTAASFSGYALKVTDAISGTGLRATLGFGLKAAAVVGGTDGVVNLTGSCGLPTPTSSPFSRLTFALLTT